MSQKIRVLLIEDNPDDVVLIQRMLDQAKSALFDLMCAGRLDEGLACLISKEINVVLLDLSLPDSGGLETFDRTQSQAPNVPIVVLAGLDDEELAVQAVREGAQDYLVKGQVESNLLVRALRYAIERKRVEEALRQRNRELGFLNRASQAFNSTLDLDKVLLSIMEEVRYLLGVTGTSVWLIDPDTDELVCLQAPGPESEVVRGWRLAPGEGLAGWVAQHGTSEIVPDIQADERHFKGIDRQIGLTLRSILSVPLRVKNKIIGVLQVVDTELDRFALADLTLVEPLAASAAIAIENAHLYATEQQHIAALARALEKQKELDRLKDEFIQNVSHELRTPLALIRGYAEILVSGELGQLDTPQQEPLSVIARRSRSLCALVEDITALLENVTHQPVRGPVFMVELANIALAEFRPQAEKAGLTLSSEIAKSVPLVSGNALHLRKVVDSLLSNALKFTPAGGTISLGLHSTGRRVVLRVSDTGIGIPIEHLDRIFERFYQIDGSASRRYGGTGLGLALVKEVVESHGGQVTVESQLGQGSTFTVSLPCMQG